jgi:L-threonylcarbamoyladenylate synthase
MLQVLHVDPALPRAERVERAARTIAEGEVVALPTETFYGLAVDPFQPRALHRLNELKGKAPDSPALLLLADVEQARQVAGPLPGPFASLAASFWPGPLTLVVPACDRLPPEVSGGRGTVGVRVPGLALPRRLAAALGRPITGVSANLHGEAPARTAAEVARVFPRGLGLLLDGGPAPGGAASTILDLTGPVPRLVRAGAIPVASLRPFLPLVGA